MFCTARITLKTRLFRSSSYIALKRAIDNIPASALYDCRPYTAYSEPGILILCRWSGLQYTCIQQNTNKPGCSVCQGWGQVHVIVHRYRYSGNVKVQVQNISEYLGTLPAGTSVVHSFNNQSNALLSVNPSTIFNH